MSAPLMEVDRDSFAVLGYTSVIEACAAGCLTRGGRDMVTEIMSSPLACEATLARRRGDLQKVIDYEARLGERSPKADILRRAAGMEGILSDLCDPACEAALEAEEAALFRGRLSVFNSCWPALWVKMAAECAGSPLFFAALPALLLASPYLILTRRLNLRISFRSYVRLLLYEMRVAGRTMTTMMGAGSALAAKAGSVSMSIAMYLQNVILSLRASHKTRKGGDYLHGAVHGAEALLGLVAELNSIEDQTGRGSIWGARAEPASEGGDARDPRLERRYRAFRDRGLKIGKRGDAGGGESAGGAGEGRPSPLSPVYAARLSSYTAIKDDPAPLVDTVKPLFLYDALRGIALHASEAGMCPVAAISRGLALKNVRPPPSSPNAQGNDVCLLQVKARGIAVSGGRATGKTTLLMSIACAVLTAQTTGFCNADQAAMSPNRYLATALPAPDSLSGGFGAAGECVQAACSSPDRPGLVLMDALALPAGLGAGGFGVLVAEALAKCPGCVFVSAFGESADAEKASAVPGVRAARASGGSPYRITKRGESHIKAG